MLIAMLDDLLITNKKNERTALHTLVSFNTRKENTKSPYILFRQKGFNKEKKYSIIMESNMTSKKSLKKKRLDCTFDFKYDISKEDHSEDRNVAMN